MKSDIVRAWKDAWRRQSLISEQQVMPSENALGTCELNDSDLEAVQGGSSVEGVLEDLGGLGNLGTENRSLYPPIVTHQLGG